MTFTDSADESRRLADHYREMTDGELLTVAEGRSELTPVAQQVLSGEIARRKLTMPPELNEEDSRRANSTAYREEDPDSEYAEDRELVVLDTVWSIEDALTVQSRLDGASIPFFMGAEKATGVDAVTSNFSNGIAVYVMQIGLQWARQAMQYYTPTSPLAAKDKPEEPSTLDSSDRVVGGFRDAAGMLKSVAAKKEDSTNDGPLVCPKCGSDGVGLEEVAAPTPQDTSLPKYKWFCDSCGNKWEDDGFLDPDPS